MFSKVDKTTLYIIKEERWLKPCLLYCLVQSDTPYALKYEILMFIYEVEAFVSVLGN